MNHQTHVLTPAYQYVDSDLEFSPTPRMVKDPISAVKDSTTVAINTHSRDCHHIIVYSSEGKKMAMLHIS